MNATEKKDPFLVLTPDKIQAYYDRCQKVAIGFMEEGIGEHPDAIPLREYYERILDPMALDQFLDWEFSPVETSDTFYHSLPAIKQHKFEERERERWRRGLWTRVEAFWQLPREQQETIRLTHPTAGWLQLLTPEYYVFLNYMSVKTKRGGALAHTSGIERPGYRKKQDMYFRMRKAAQMCRTTDTSRLGMFMLKMRGSGFSTSECAAHIVNMHVIPGYTGLIGLNDQSKILTIARELEQLYKSLPNWVRPHNPITGDELFAKKITGTKDHKELKIYMWDSANERVAAQENVIHVLDHMPEHYEGYRANEITLDEIGLCAHSVTDLFEKCGACMRADDMPYRTGLLIAGGTSSENNRKNNPIFRAIMTDPIGNGFLLNFHGTQHGGSVDAKGWPDSARRIRAEQEQRNKYIEKGDKKKLSLTKTIDPLCCTDCLEVPGEEGLPIERMQKQLTEIEQAIREGAFKIHRFKLMPGKDESGNHTDYESPVRVDLGPEEALETGWWYAVEYPREASMAQDPYSYYGRTPGGIYFAGVDVVDQSTDPRTAEAIRSGVIKKSMHSMVIMNVLNNQVIAVYLNRQPNPDDDYKQTLLGAMYYNCKTLIERNRPSCINFIKYFKGEPYGKQYPEGYFTAWLYPKPKFMDGKVPTSKAGYDWRNVNYGLTTTGNGSTKFPKDHLYRTFVIPFFDQFTDVQLHPLFLSEMMKWSFASGENSDIGMAFMMCIIGAQDFRDDLMAKAHRSNGYGLSDVDRLSDLIAQEPFL